MASVFLILYTHIQFTAKYVSEKNSFSSHRRLKAYEQNMLYNLKFLSKTN